MVDNGVGEEVLERWCWRNGLRMLRRWVEGNEGD